MAYITEFGEHLRKGGTIRYSTWPAKCHIMLFDIKDNRLRRIGSTLMLFTPVPKTTDFKTKTYTPVWPEIIGDGWEVYNDK